MGGPGFHAGNRRSSDIVSAFPVGERGSQRKGSVSDGAQSFGTFGPVDPGCPSSQCAHGSYMPYVGSGKGFGREKEEFFFRGKWRVVERIGKGKGKSNRRM